MPRPISTGSASWLACGDREACFVRNRIACECRPSRLDKPPSGL
jgi:hypothetical protein